MIVRISNKKHPVTMKRPVILIKVTPTIASLRMLLLCINMCLKSIPRYRFVILDT